MGTLGATRFADVNAILRDFRTFSAKVRLVPPLPGTPLFVPLLQDDPPDHTRLRALVGHAFTAERVGWIPALATASGFAVLAAGLWLLIRANEPLGKATSPPGGRGP